MKRKINVFCLVLMSSLALLTSVKAGPIGVYINDTFSGTTLDSAIWNSNGTVVVNSGSLTVNANGGQFSYINSIPTVVPDAGQKVVLTGLGLSSVPFSDGLGFGLYNLDNTNFIMINELGNGSLTVDIRNNNNTVQTSAGFGTNGFNGDFVLSWTATQVVVTQNANVVFDSNVNGPNGGGSWNLPTVALSATAYSYINSNTLTMDAVSLEIVPEPSTMAMIGLAGLGLLAKRRKRAAI